jgi:hypothetical protein
MQGKQILPQSRWAYCCRVLALLSVVALSISLATRFPHISVHQTTLANSRSDKAVRQQLDRDALQWADPTPRFTLLEATTFYPRVAPAGPPLPVLLLDQSLYTRPPPSR